MQVQGKSIGGIVLLSALIVGIYSHRHLVSFLANVTKHDGGDNTPASTSGKYSSVGADRETLDNLWLEADLDRNGLLDPVEVGKLLSNYGYPSTFDWRIYDGDGDGKLTKDQFIPAAQAAIQAMNQRSFLKDEEHPTNTAMGDFKHHNKLYNRAYSVNMSLQELSRETTGRCGTLRAGEKYDENSCQGNYAKVASREDGNGGQWHCVWCPSYSGQSECKEVSWRMYGLVMADCVKDYLKEGYVKNPTLFDHRLSARKLGKQLNERGNPNDKLIAQKMHSIGGSMTTEIMEPLKSAAQLCKGLHRFKDCRGCQEQCREASKVGLCSQCPHGYDYEDDILYINDQTMCISPLLRPQCLGLCLFHLQSVGAFERGMGSWRTIQDPYDVLRLKNAIRQIPLGKLDGYRDPQNYIGFVAQMVTLVHNKIGDDGIAMVIKAAGAPYLGKHKDPHHTFDELDANTIRSFLSTGTGNHPLDALIDFIRKL